MDKNIIINTKEEARDYAIEWQSRASEESMSYSELAEAQAFFTELGHRFGLLGEFEKNGII
jgi:hypothetical protein